jgi:hypothetical protein
MDWAKFCGEFFTSSSGHPVFVHVWKSKRGLAQLEEGIAHKRIMFTITVNNIKQR